jgi:hypothetical protein
LKASNKHLERLLKAEAMLKEKNHQQIEEQKRSHLSKQEEQLPLQKQNVYVVPTGQHYLPQPPTQPISNHQPYSMQPQQHFVPANGLQTQQQAVAPVAPGLNPQQLAAIAQGLYPQQLDVVPAPHHHQVIMLNMK